VIIHCTRKLAARLPDVSAAALPEASPLGSWHANLVPLARRQCVLFCHDVSRYCLFLPGAREPMLADLAQRHRELFLATLALEGVDEARRKRVDLAVGPMRFDSATERSVLGSMITARSHLDGMRLRRDHMLERDPAWVSRDLNSRPATVLGRWHIPRDRMLEKVMAL
jgi:hypothetical protein